MTKMQLMQAAFHHFGEQGYNGGSLAQIADEVGIKKQSIYTYFKSKDALYLAIYEEAMQFELTFIQTFMEKMRDEPIEQALLPLLQQVAPRFLQNVETKFFIRSTFLTPHHLQDAICKKTYDYLDTIQALFAHYFSTKMPREKSDEAAVAYLALLDSLYVEMLYGGSVRFKQRLQAGWNVFYRGISN